MEQKEITLINKSGCKQYINFAGVFPHNKWARANGKVYLTEKEWEWCEINIPASLEKGLWVLEGAEDPKKGADDIDPEAKKADFFKQHVNKAKAQVAKMEDLAEVNALIDYANDNEIDNKTVDALIERANKLGE